MARPLNWKNFAAIIDTIRKQSVELEDLLALGIPERTLYRYLEKLGKTGVNLVRKQEKNWVWCGYEYPREKTPQEFALEIDHAKKLMPGLQPLLEEDQTFLLEYREKPHVDLVEDVHRLIEQSYRGAEYKLTEERWKNFRLSEYFEEHLKSGYPEIYHNLCFYRQEFSNYDEVLSVTLPIIEKAKERNKKRGGNPHVPLFNNDQEINLYKKYLYWQINLKRTYYELFDWLQNIRISVEVGGNPLRGHCRACPNIIIKEEK